MKIVNDIRRTYRMYKFFKTGRRRVPFWDVYKAVRTR